MSTLKTPKPHEVRQARLNRNFTQQQAADLIQVSVRTWTGWESGRTEMHAVMFDWFVKRAAVSVGGETKCFRAYCTKSPCINPSNCGVFL